jgi:hypothetical protein
MKNIFSLLILFISSLAYSNDINERQLPTECIETLNEWNNLLFKMKTSDKISKELMEKHKAAQKLIESAWRKTPSSNDKLITSCTDIQNLNKLRLKSLESSGPADPNFF